MLETFDRIVVGVVAALVAGIAVVIALGDHVGVPIRDVSPADGSQPPITAPIRVTFAEAMNRESVEARLSIEPAIEGRFHWEDNMVIFTPASPLTPGQTYSATLAEGIESAAGRRSPRPLSWSFSPRTPRVMYLAPANSDLRSLWLIAAEGDLPRQLFAPQYGIFNYAPSPDGEQVAVSVLNENLTSDLWLLNSDGSNARLILPCSPGSCSNPAWSPDGTMIAYERQEVAPSGAPGPSRVWLYDVATGRTAPVFEDNQVLGFGPAWSPDGARLAFFDGSAQAIRVVAMDGSSSYLLPSQMGEVGSFSPDGSAMVYTDIRPVGQQFYAELWLATFGVDGGLQPLIAAAEEDQSATWSPDGRQIAFARRRIDRQGGFGGQLMIYDLTSQELRALTNDSAYNHTRFEWNPTGEQILVQRFNLEAINGAPELWVYDCLLYTSPSPRDS